MSYSAAAATDCGLCWKRSRSALFVNGMLRPSNLMAIQLWICDDCLMLVVEAVERGVQEAEEAGAGLEVEGQ